MNFSIIEVFGKDAADFLHRLTSADFIHLSPGNATRGLFLTGTAKLEAVFEAFCLEDNLFYLLTEQPDNVTGNLEKMHFGESLQWRKLSSASSFLKKNEASAWSDTAVRPINKDSNTFYFASAVPDYFLFISFNENNQKIESDHLAFEEKRIASLIPAFGNEYVIGDSAVNVGLLKWINREKGCYPGQEVIEKSLTVGHPAKKLTHVKADKNLSLAEALYDGEKQIGKITSVCKNEGLAIVKWSALKAEITLGDGTRINLSE